MNNNNMNNLGPSTPQRTFDFSRPPPGYSVPPADPSRVFRTPPGNPSRPIYPGVSKRDTDYTRHEVSSSDEPRSSFSRCPDITQNVSPHPRSSSLEAIGPPSRSVPTLTPPETPAPLDPRMFNMPPPLPHADPYGFNIAVPRGGYILSSTVYAFPGPPPAPPPPPPQAPPPPPASAMGAGHYATQQPGNFRQQQFQGEYSPGYPKRNAVNNQLNRKRSMPQEFQSDSPKKTTMAKKKKKPLSQNMPSKKDWSLEDAKRALDVEREFNRRNNTPSLIIKFPDLELNRDIVSQFHPKIQSVHFQKPSTQRYCFVTLKDSACMEEVVSELNKVKFGQGYLSAEIKQNKDDDMVKGPEDIDPLTLYVGNLAQEVTVEDVVKAYPKHKRIDIGFAKKMKYTRYAFVCFRTVDDAIEAFQNTRDTQMYHQSLIVRFRRLHGTVGMPGDPKPQKPPRQKESESSDHTPTEDVAQGSHASELVVTKCDPEVETPEFTATNLFEGARVKTEPFDESVWDLPTPGDDYFGEKTHVPIYEYKIKDDPDAMRIKQEMLDDLNAPNYLTVGNGDDSSEDECLISSTSFE